MLGLDPEEPGKPVLNYGSPRPRSTGRTLLGALAGMGGYVGLFIGNQYFLRWPTVGQGDWRMPLLATLPPLLVMVVAARLLKSRAMLIASLITFGMFLLACGTCYALLSGMR